MIRRADAYAVRQEHQQRLAEANTPLVEQVDLALRAAKVRRFVRHIYPSDERRGRVTLSGQDWQAHVRPKEAVRAVLEMMEQQAAEDALKGHAYKRRRSMKPSRGMRAII